MVYRILLANARNLHACMGFGAYNRLMPALWEREADYPLRQLRDEGLTPYAELRRWKRLFYYVCAICVVQTVFCVVVCFLFFLGSAALLKR